MPRHTVRLYTDHTTQCHKSDSEAHDASVSTTWNRYKRWFISIVGVIITLVSTLIGINIIVPQRHSNKQKGKHYSSDRECITKWWYLEIRQESALTPQQSSHRRGMGIQGEEKAREMDIAQASIASSHESRQSFRQSR